jgi:CRISPR/Cas system CSM-associated protein Csm3 (group 7 of RAMP superfamily)
MTDVIYKIYFFDFWSTSSGLSGGALADSLCLKDKNGLPFLPGKTIKGLFREAAEILQNLNYDGIDNNFIFSVFGEPEHQDSDNNKEERTIIASSFFTNASLNELTANGIIQQNYISNLFEQIASTALEESGLAKKNSLRRIEYALPCTLYGKILDVGSYKTQLSLCASFIKRLGLNRHRGFGRCKISLL